MYHSSKIPFAADYLSFMPEQVSDSRAAAYHGTHVAGIAAGNMYEDEEGRMHSGVAPDAQILFFGLDSPWLEYSDMIAAMEDAVKLQADVLNISQGNLYEILKEDDPIRDAVNCASALRSAGR